MFSPKVFVLSYFSVSGWVWRSILVLVFHYRNSYLSVCASLYMYSGAWVLTTLIWYGQHVLNSCGDLHFISLQCVQLFIILPQVLYIWIVVQLLMISRKKVMIITVFWAAIYFNLLFICSSKWVHGMKIDLYICTLALYTHARTHTHTHTTHTETTHPHRWSQLMSPTTN